MYEDWSFSRYCAKIVGLDEYPIEAPKYVDTLYKNTVSFDSLRVVCTAGGFDLIHSGHISYIFDASDLGDLSVVIVKSDELLSREKGKPVYDLKTRCQTLSSLFAVDLIVPLEAHHSLSDALKIIKPSVFVKGKPVEAQSLPEWPACVDLGTQVVSGVGLQREHLQSPSLESS